MHIPIVGKLIVAKELNLFSRTFASLQKNNVLLTDSIDILSKITNNEIYRELMLRTVNNLIKGNKMSETFTNHWAVPDIAKFMIVTGESTGELAEMLDKVADYYQKEEKNTVASIKTFIEPVMIVGLAVVVGFILVAILIPMFDIYSTVS
jgi:type IV pilus assembly protein PilC